MANNWTDQQLEAINLEGSNIIVSAGAGSGKTAVLSERVLRKIEEGIHINEILILTFTNAAAKEMKDRIRSKLRENGKIEEANLIDSSYITTFDSFSLSLVKKYHTVLNINKEVGITDSSLLYLKKLEIIENIFNKYYEQDDIKFHQFIQNFCFKDDKELKNLLIKLNDRLDMKYNKQNYLDNYLATYYTEDFISQSIDNYYKEIQKLILKIKDIVRQLNLYLDFDYIIKLEDKLAKLYKATNYDEVVEALDFRLPNLPRNQEDEVKELKETLSSYIKEIKELCLYENSQKIKEEILATKQNINIIIDIIKEFDKQFNHYKLSSNMFDFSDINRMAIKLVSENEEIKEELKNSFQEIMIDEYQDTNDIGEFFISLISNNNVYMVGDIKQSIYRFRNANPYIFKSKYDLYSNNNNQGRKIDLLKNFRSRKEVLSGINLIFNSLMDDYLGGADYKNTHQMVFGNNSYDNEGKTTQNYDLSILTYEPSKEFSNNEQEIFIIANDIKNKIESKYQIFDKDTKVLKNIDYNDFVILIDRSSDFDNYKKVFEYLGIPLSLYKDEELTKGNDILVIKNLLKLIQCLDQEDYSETFKYAFLSIGRSFLFRENDDILFDYITNDTYKESLIYKKLEEAYNYYYELSTKQFFIKLGEIFQYEENLLKVGDIQISCLRLEYFYNLIENFSENGNDLNDFINYLNDIFAANHKVTFALNNNTNNSVKIMTIHKSKGLEFPICYFSGFSKEFSMRELNDNILYSDKYGIIIPYFDNFYKPTIYKTLFKQDVKREELSEKIRLFYVALTRAKEQTILVMPNISETNIEKEKIKSFYDMIKYIYPSILPYIEEQKVKCTKDYLYNLNTKEVLNSKKTNQIKILDYNFLEEEVIEEKYSKNKHNLITKEESLKMQLGTKIHEILEFIDFKNPDYNSIDKELVPKIKHFIESDMIKNNLEYKFYKEYEFIYQEDKTFKRGIIDLLIEADDKIMIIDYKLKNTLDEAYQKQLLGYKKAISELSNKSIETYLYSIIDEKYTKINN